MVAWGKWGDVFNHYVRLGHDHSSAAFAADEWEKRRQNARKQSEKPE